MTFIHSVVIRSHLICTSENQWGQIRVGLCQQSYFEPNAFVYLHDSCQLHWGLITVHWTRWKTEFVYFPPVHLSMPKCPDSWVADCPQRPGGPPWMKQASQTTEAFLEPMWTKPLRFLLCCICPCVYSCSWNKHLTPFPMFRSLIPPRTRSHCIGMIWTKNRNQASRNEPQQREKEGKN